MMNTTLCIQYTCVYTYNIVYVVPLLLFLYYFFTSTEINDYTALTATVTLTPTVPEGCVSVIIKDDSVLEETEFLTVSLSLIEVLDSVQLSQQTATVVITDDDGKGLTSVPGSSLCTQ